MICPDCKGERETVAAHVSYANGTHGYNVPHQCGRCDATGEVPDEMAQWIIDGRKMRDRRVNGKPYRSVHEEAKRLGISAEQLSRMEFGKVKPDLSIGNYVAASKDGKT